MPKASQRIVNGDDLLYRFFNELLLDDSELAGRLPVQMLSSMGIWLPLDVYYEWPVMLPWVVRDASCRGSRRHGLPDEWGAPDDRGFLRDDNSLVKSLPRSLSVSTPAGRHLRGARMGNEFVASHIWRIVKHEDLASRHPLLNSFVPNLIWLPKQVSKLSDREGGPVQAALQSMSWAIYRHAPVAPHLTEVVEEAWSLLPEPELSIDFDEAELNWFESTPTFFSTRRSRLQSVLDALMLLEAGEPLDRKVITTRYGDGLPQVSSAARSALRSRLQAFRP